MAGGSWADTQLLRRKLEFSGVRREIYWAVGLHEVTFAINLFNHDLLECWDRAEADAWKASHGPQWLTGTIDWYVENTYGPPFTRTPFGLIPWVDDLKTGRWPVDPNKSRQLRSYALYSYLKFHKDSRWRCALSITQWPKYPIDGLPERKWARRAMTALDAEVHLDDLRYALEHPDETNPTEEACKFCDSKPVCKEWAL